MKKTSVTLYTPDGKNLHYTDVESASVDDKGILWIQPKDSGMYGGKTIMTSLPFKITEN